MSGDALAQLWRTPPRTTFAGVPDDAWLWLNTAGSRLCPALEEYLPGLPNEAVQSRSRHDRRHGAGHAVNAYRIFKGLYEAHVGPIDASTIVLDFGCGWGRVLRFFLREVNPDQLVGSTPTWRSSRQPRGRAGGGPFRIAPERRPEGANASVF